jgi:hypothetical protein
MQWVETLSLSAAQANVMNYLGHRINNECICWPSRGRISLGTKLSERTISRVFGNLENRQILKIDRTRDKAGRLRYKTIELCIPSAFLSRNKAPNDTVSLGPSDTLSNSPGEPSDTVAHRSIQLLDNYSEEEKIEAKIAVTENFGYSSPIKNNSNFGEKKQIIVIKDEDRQSLFAGIGTLLHSNDVGYEIDKWASDDLKPLLDACILVSRYMDSCAKGSPKARVAFWHELGRIHYPTLARFSVKHKLPAGQCRHLNQFFDQTKQQGCAILVSIFANWPGALASVEWKSWGDNPPRVPEIEYVALDLKSFINFWVHEFKAIEFDSNIERTRILTRLGISA